VSGLREPPTETQLRGLWPGLITRDDGDDGKVFTEILFDRLPEPPAGWSNKTGSLDFTLRKGEAEYLRKIWSVVGDGGSPPLLSRLAEAGVTSPSLWSSAVRRFATPSERHALELAQRAASVACIARAAYSALVEERRNRDRGRNDRRHAEALPILIEEHREKALALDVAALKRETCIDDRLLRFIGTVMDWVRERLPLESIATELTCRERDLKDNRAYLLNDKRRRDWRKGIATPLDYRWPVVRDMIERVREVS
jgi:hypothetical protein